MNMKRLGKALTRLLSAAAFIMGLMVCGFADDTTTATSTTTGSSWSMILIFVVMLVVFYFFLIRPENKKKKQQEQMRSELAVGDTITTIGGIVGKLVDVKENYAVFETGEDRVRIQIAKWAISTKGKAAEEQK